MAAFGYFCPKSTLVCLIKDSSPWPNRRAGPNKRAGGKIFKNIKSAGQNRRAVGTFSGKSINVQGKNL